MLTPEEVQCLKEFRDYIKLKYDADVQDYILMIFLRATEVDLEKAKLLFAKSLEVQNLLTGNSSVIDHGNHISMKEIAENVTYKYLGTDTEGRLVIWLPAGRWNFRKHLQDGLKTELCLHCFKHLDDVSRILFEQGEKSGKHQSVVLIADFEKLTVKKATHVESVKIALSLVKDVQILAKLMHKFYLVNGSALTRSMFVLARPFLSSKTTKKIVKLSPKKKNWKKVLQDNIPIDILPEEYGGNGPSVLNVAADHDSESLSNLSLNLQQPQLPQPSLVPSPSVSNSEMILKSK